jgi:hypothetical protein
MNALLLLNGKRRIVASLVLGCLAEFAVWYITYTANSDPYTARYPWFDRL